MTPSPAAGRSGTPVNSRPNPTVERVLNVDLDPDTTAFERRQGGNSPHLATAAIPAVTGGKKPAKRLYTLHILYTAMGTISTRVPDELEGELDAYLEEERLDRSTAVRKLLAEGLEEWRREQALDRLAAEEITFTKAAQLAGMSVWEFAQLTTDHDITWVSADHLEADLEEL